MCATFSNGDVGKSVLDDNGEAVGVVASVDGDVAHVRPETDAVDSIKSSIGWEGVADATRPLDAGSVREITDDAVRLEGDLPSVDERDLEETDAVDEEGTNTDDERRRNANGADEADASDGPETSRDRPSDRGLEADPTELARQEREGGAQSGPSVEPTDEFEPTGAAVDPDAETEPTDAAVDPNEDADGDTDRRED